MKVSVLCSFCGSGLLRDDRKSKSRVFFCNVKCKSSFQVGKIWSDDQRRKMSEYMLGENNPNFGNKWTTAQRESFSSMKVQYFIDNPDVAHECGKANRGKTLSEEVRQSFKTGKANSSYDYFHTKNMTEFTKGLIGLKSSLKFTPDFKSNFRKTMEDRGHWIPLDKISSYKKYFKEADWLDSMVKYFTDEDITILNSLGMFNPISNTKGFVRDHIVERKDGWRMNIPTYIIRHPANMQFISHSANVSKATIHRNTLSDNDKLLFVQCLMEKIIDPKYKNWVDQEICILYIESLNE